MRQEKLCMFSCNISLRGMIKHALQTVIVKGYCHDFLNKLIEITNIFLYYNLFRSGFQIYRCGSQHAVVAPSIKICSFVIYIYNIIMKHCNLLYQI